MEDLKQMLRYALVLVALALPGTATRRVCRPIWRIERSNRARQASPLRVLSDRRYLLASPNVLTRLALAAGLWPCRFSYAGILISGHS